AISPHELYLRPSCSASPRSSRSRSASHSSPQAGASQALEAAGARRILNDYSFFSAGAEALRRGFQPRLVRGGFSEPPCKEGHAEVRQEHHADPQDVQGIQGRGKTRAEGGPPRGKGGRPRAPAS